MKSDLINHKFCPSKGLSIILAIALLMFSTVSCNKDDDVVLTKTQLLTSSPWVFEGVETGDLTFDVLFNFFLIGAKITFTTSGTYVFTFTLDPSSDENGTWKFNASETVITLDNGTPPPEDWNILVLNANQLKISFEDSDVGSTVEILFKH